MQKKDEKTLSRREFMKLAAMVAGVAAVSGTGLVSCQKTQSDSLAEKSIPRLNPAFRIKEISANEIELFTHLGNGEILKHQFTGLEADLFREIAKEQEIKSLIPTIAQKHHLPVEVCRKEIRRSLSEFETAKLIYFGDKMIVKLVEIKNG